MSLLGGVHKISKTLRAAGKKSEKPQPQKPQPQKPQQKPQRPQQKPPKPQQKPQKPQQKPQQPPQQTSKGSKGSKAKPKTLEELIGDSEIFKAGCELASKYGKFISSDGIVQALEELEQVCGSLPSLSSIQMPLRCMVFPGDVLPGYVWRVTMERPKGRNLYDMAPHSWVHIGAKLPAFVDRVRDVLTLSPEQHRELELHKVDVYAGSYLPVGDKFIAPMDHRVGCNRTDFFVDHARDCIVCNNPFCGISVPLRQTREGADFYMYRRDPSRVTVHGLKGHHEHFMAQLMAVCGARECSVCKRVPPFGHICCDGQVCGKGGISFGVAEEALALISRAQWQRKIGALQKGFTGRVEIMCVASLLYVHPDALRPSVQTVAPKPGETYVHASEFLEADLEVASDYLNIAKRCPSQFRSHFLQCAYDPRRGDPDQNPDPGWVRLKFECGRCKKTFSSLRAMHYVPWHSECRAIVRALVMQDLYYTRESEVMYRESIMGLDSTKRTRNEKLYDAVKKARSFAELRAQVVTIHEEMDEVERVRRPDLFVRAAEALAVPLSRVPAPRMRVDDIDDECCSCDDE